MCYFKQNPFNLFETRLVYLNDAPAPAPSGREGDDALMDDAIRSAERKENRTKARLAALSEALDRTLNPLFRTAESNPEKSGWNSSSWARIERQKAGRFAELAEGLPDVTGLPQKQAPLDNYRGIFGFIRDEVFTNAPAADRNDLTLMACVNLSKNGRGNIDRYPPGCTITHANGYLTVMDPKGDRIFEGDLFPEAEKEPIEGEPQQIATFDESEVEPIVGRKEPPHLASAK